MIIDIFIVLIAAVIGSYFSLFNPSSLSKSCTELNSEKLKWLGSIFSIIISISLVLILQPITLQNWLEFFIILLIYFISLIDIYTKIIPNLMLVLLIVISLINIGINTTYELVLIGSITFILLFIINTIVNNILRKNLLGWGDVKLISIIALLVGKEIILVIYIALVIGGLLSIIGMLSKKLTRDTKIPLAIFLLIGTLIIQIDLL